MTVKDILTDALKAMGVDGLCNRDMNCGCGIEDFASCDCSGMDCEPAKGKIATAEDIDEESDYEIGNKIYVPYEWQREEAKP